MRHFEKEFSFPFFFYFYRRRIFVSPLLFPTQCLPASFGLLCESNLSWFCPSGSLPIQHGDAHTPSKEWLSFKLFLSLFVTLCVCVLDFTPAPLLSPSDSPLCASLLFRHQEIPLRWTVDYRDSGAVGMGRRTIKEMTERLRAEEEKEENHSA